MPWECRIIVLVIFTAALALVGQPWGGVSPRYPAAIGFKNTVHTDSAKFDEFNLLSVESLLQKSIKLAALFNLSH